MSKFITNAVKQDQCFLQFPKNHEVAALSANLFTAFAKFFEKLTPLIRTSTSDKKFHRETPLLKSL